VRINRLVCGCMLAIVLTGCSGVSECDPEQWGEQAFDAVGWSTASDRTHYFKSIRRDFPGLDMGEVEARLGEPRSRHQGSTAWKYGLGRIRFWSCEVAVGAFMLVEYGEDSRVSRLSAYVD
jgi:hypothetical protein